jgi:hypothetical protein
MQNASTRRKRVLRVSRDFETSRFEKGLLAAAYERAVPIISRRPKRNGGKDFLESSLAPSPTETDFQFSLAMERCAG